MELREQLMSLERTLLNLARTDIDLMLQKRGSILWHAAENLWSTYLLMIASPKYGKEPEVWPKKNWARTDGALGKNHKIRLSNREIVVRSFDPSMQLASHREGKVRPELHGGCNV